MIPVQLTLQNFLSYGPAPTTLDFSKFRIACLTGDNGHGKSALLDAITYALWGQARKSRQDRKPDEGLLKLGASTMHVELVFDLDSERYRIIRSFRRRGKTPVSQLELHICDLDSGSYRPISETGRILETQTQIEKLLCMDYRTFVNSAFLVQGCSGEFTQNSARERKAILADILGLKRYDELQILARKHLSALQVELHRIDARLGEIDFELQRKPKIEESFQQVSAELKKQGEHLEQIDSLIEQKRSRCTDFENAYDSLPSCRKTNRHTLKHLSSIEQEQTHIKESISVEDAILDRAADIEAHHTHWRKLNRENQQQIQALGQLRKLEGKKASLERRIEEACHEVKKNQAVEVSKRDELQRELDRLDVIIEETDDIEKSMEELEITKRRAAHLEISREHHDALIKKRTEVAHKIEMENQTLHERQISLRNSMSSIIDLLITSESDQRRKQRQHRLVLRLVQSLSKADKLRQRHFRLDAELKGWQTKLAAVLDLEIALHEKIDLLAQRENPECPLCGTDLDDEHRAQINEKFLFDSCLYKRQCQSIEEIVNQLQAEQTQLSVTIKEIEHRCRELTEEQQLLTNATTHLQRLKTEHFKFSQLSNEERLIENHLQELTFAFHERQILDSVDTEISTLNFDSTDLAYTREKTISLQKAVQQYAVIKEARSRRESLVSNLETITHEVTVANDILIHNQYALPQQQQLVQINAQIDELCYDSHHHQAIQHRLNELADVPADNERLQSASEKLTDLTYTLKKLKAQEDDLILELARLHEKLKSLEKRSGKLIAAREELDEFVKHANELRSKRDEMLINQGALQSQIEHFCKLEVERKKISTIKDDAARDASIYSILDEAFGKNGIQALIIENAIPEIEEEANSLLRRLTDNRIHVSLESLQDLKKGGTKETLDIVISDELGERSYDLYSGGEAFRTDFAIRIALSKVLARRAGTKLRTLIIDEGFGTQDRSGLEHLIDAIHEVSKDFDKLIVVTHLIDLKDAFPMRIDITKDPTEGSQIRIAAE